MNEIPEPNLHDGLIDLELVYERLEPEAGAIARRAYHAEKRVAEVEAALWEIRRWATGSPRFYAAVRKAESLVDTVEKAQPEIHP